MYTNVSSAFEEVIARDSRTFYARISREADGEIVDSGIMSMRLQGQTHATEYIGIGDAVSSMIEVSLREPEDIKFEGREFLFEIGLLLDEETEEVEWIPLGLFTPLHPTKDNGIITFQAYDRLYSRMTGAYFTEIKNYPCDAKLILDEISEQTGIPINTSELPSGITVDKRKVVGESTFDDQGNEQQNITYTEPFNGYMYREALTYIAQLYGKIVTCDRFGNISLRWYEETDFRVTTSHYYDDLVMNENDFHMNMISCSVNGEKLTVGSGTISINFENPFMTQAQLEYVYSKIGDFTFCPSTVSFLGDIRVDLCDIVTVEAKDGTEVRIPVMDIEFDFDGGVITSIGSRGGLAVSEKDGAQNVVSPTAQALDRFYTEFLLVKEIIGSKASFVDLQATNASFQNLYSDYADFKNLNAANLTAISGKIDDLISVQVTTEYLNANFAQINLANIEKGSIQTYMLGEGVVGTAQIADSSITDAKIVGLTANKITAGRLDAGTIEVVNLNADNITTGSINGQLIGSGTINFEQLNSSVAQNITEAAIDGIQVGSENLIRNSRSLVFNDYFFDYEGQIARVDYGRVDYSKVGE